MSAFKKVTEALDKFELFGSSGRNLISKGFEPTVAVNVAYKEGAAADLGNTNSIESTQDEPEVSFTAEGAPTDRYVVVLADPDAPSKSDPKWSPFLHWVQGGLISASEGNAQQSGVNPLMKYMGPAPPPGTGPHRYVFLLYREHTVKGHEDPTPAKLHRSGDGPEARKNWDVEEFVKSNELVLVGVNFFLAEDKSKSE